MSRVLIIGYGNTLRGDDGAGPRVAEMIAHRFPQVDSLALNELQPELAEAVSSYDEVIFVDAHVLQKSLVVTEIRMDSGSRPADSFAHSPHSILSLSRDLYGHRPERALLIQIPAFNVGFSEGLSPQTERAVEQCTGLIEALICTKGEATSKIM